MRFSCSATTLCHTGHCNGLDPGEMCNATPQRQEGEPNVDSDLNVTDHLSSIHVGLSDWETVLIIA